MTLEVVSPTAALLDGRYLLEDRVGQGGMASVYRAQDTHLGRTVAIKMIHKGDSLLGSADRAHTEKALLASLNHPSLVTLFDAQLERGRPQYLVMEFIDGPTLAEPMARGPIPERHLARIMRGLAEGLAAVHAAGIVHRDVKPSNVLLAPPRNRDSDSWTAKLADFGIAYSMEDSARLTTPGVVLGTLTYMSPEQLTDTDPGTPVDIYALGLIALEALTGEPAYPATGSGRAAAVARVMNPPTIPDTLDADWRDLVERMTRVEPLERPSAAEVARAARDLVRRSSSTTDETPLFVAAGGVVIGTATKDEVDSAAATSPGDPETTQKTAVLPPAVAPSRIRRRAVFGAGALALVGALVTTAAVLSPAAADIARSSSDAVVRAPAVPVAAEETVPDAVPEETTPVETVTDPDDDVVGNQGNGNPGNGNQGKGDKASDKKSENSGKPDKAKG